MSWLQVDEHQAAQILSQSETQISHVTLAQVTQTFQRWSVIHYFPDA